MKMIDVMKRLAELDSNNPSIVKESQNVEECGMMPEIGMGMGAMERPSTPASINMTAGSGEELSDMLATIMQLAGVKQHGDEEPMSAEPALAIAAEPEMDANADMRSVMDLMNPQDDQSGEEADGISGLDRDHDGDHDMGDHELEKDDKEDDEEADEGQYDNSPANPIKPPMFNANKYAHQENQPGQGDRMDGDRPKAYADMNEATRALFAEYKKFVSEAYNPNSAGATHSRDVNASHKADLEKKAAAGDKGAKKRLAAMKDKADTRRNDYNDRMERESVDDSMSPLEQQIRDRLEELHDEMEPEYAYEQVAHEFGMSQEELQHKLANGFDTDGGELDEISDKLAKSANQGRADRAELALRHAGTKTGFDGQVADLAAHRTSNALDRNYRMQDKRDARRAAAGVSEGSYRTNSSSMTESKPSAGMSKSEKSSLAKKAKAGKDIGKPGKSFDKVAAKAGGGEKGKKIAAAAMWKNAAKK